MQIISQTDSSFMLCVVGEFNAGKSTFSKCPCTESRSLPIASLPEWFRTMAAAQMLIAACPLGTVTNCRSMFHPL